MHSVENQHDDQIEQVTTAWKNDEMYDNGDRKNNRKGTYEDPVDCITKK